MIPIKTYIFLATLLLAPYISAETTDKWVVSAKEVIIEERLTNIELSCIEFEKDIEENGNIILITAYEIHSTYCKGDVNTNPRLFFIEFNLIESLILSDAKSPYMEMEFIRKIDPPIKK